jgi:F-type H+-transporting ATPase subunit c
VVRKLASVIGLAVMLLLGLAAPAFAQEAAKPPEQVARWMVISAAFGMAIASAFCALAQARATAAACEGLARNPGAAPGIRFALILGLVLIETIALYTFVIILAKVTY